MNLPQSHSNVTTQFGCEPMTRHHQIHVWLNDQAHAALVRLARQNDETISTTRATDSPRLSPSSDSGQQCRQRAGIAAREKELSGLRVVDDENGTRTAERSWLQVTGPHRFPCTGLVPIGCFTC